MAAERLKALVWILRPGSGGEPEVLLLQRPAPRGGGFHPVTGKGHAAESAAEAAAREAEEETGLRGSLVDVGYEHSFVDGRGRPHREVAFLLRVPAGAEASLSSEHVAARWAAPAEARAAVQWPAHRESLERALKTWNSG